MAKPSKRDLTMAILDSYGRTYAEEAGIRLKDSPAPLFQLLNLSLLLSARISSENAVRAAQALREAKLTTPQKMAAASWQDRVDILTAHGYKRYDESTSTMLGETAQVLLDNNDGDLRELRQEADCDVKTEHRLLQQFKGIGQVGADIFLREVQGIWQEAFPYADARVVKAAKKMGLSAEARALARSVDRDDFPRFVSGLVRADLEDAYDQLQEKASG